MIAKRTLEELADRLTDVFLNEKGTLLSHDYGNWGYAVNAVAILWTDGEISYVPEETSQEMARSRPPPLPQLRRAQTWWLVVADINNKAVRFINWTVTVVGVLWHITFSNPDYY